jgi:osmoprotectant transport system permease protein
MKGNWSAALAMLPERAAAHLGLAAAAVGLAVLVSVPLVLMMAARPRLRGPVLAVAGVVQTVPALALLALFYPFLLIISRLSERLIGLSVPALGFLPSLLALTLYALLPLLRGGADGLGSVAPATLDAADGIGMTRRQRLWRIELPLAAPILMGGLRVATVWTIGAATLATTIGQRSLGDLIFAGLQLQDWALVVTGCLAAAGLAIWVDLALGRVESGLARRKRGAVWLGLAGLALLGVLVVALPGLLGRGATSAGGPVVVGAKNFGEQYVLAELIAARLRAQGLEVEVRSGLGSAIAFRALAAGDIDVYVDYSGTLWDGAPLPRAEMLEALRRDIPGKHNVHVAAALGFENAYALAMPRQRAAELGIETLEDLARQAGGLRLATDIEFQSRPEWEALRRVYGLEFRSLQAFTPTLMVQALADGAADVITAFSSDGRIMADDLVLLADPKGALPAYDALLLVGPRRPWLAARLAGLSGRVDVTAMREANWQVDRETDKQTPQAAAAWLEAQISGDR